MEHKIDSTADKFIRMHLGSLLLYLLAKYHLWISHPSNSNNAIRNPKLGQ